MLIEVSEKEVKLHISALEANINYWMFESSCCDGYSKEICSAILLLEKLVGKDYKFNSQAWIDGKTFTIPELKKKYISKLKAYMPYESSYGYETFKAALKRAEKYLG